MVGYWSRREWTFGPFTLFADCDPENRHIAGGELDTNKKRHNQGGVLDDMAQAVENEDAVMGFSLSPHSRPCLIIRESSDGFP